MPSISLRVPLKLTEQDDPRATRWYFVVLMCVAYMVSIFTAVMCGRVVIENA